jgi:uncharacterized protein YdeI (YjbR/CyaY-like superfamily)
MRIETIEIDGRPASVSIAPERGQTIHEVDVPDELQQAQDASAFLAEVAKRLRPAKRKR